MDAVITPEMLASTGINVPDEQVVPMLEYFNEILEERIGESVVNSIDDQQLETLAGLQETATEEEISDWMQVNIPNLDQIIHDEVETLLGEAVEHSEEFSSRT